VKFRIVIRHDGKYIRLNVEQIYLSDQLEKYKVTGKNKSLTFQSNRPLLKALGLKNKKPDWKLIEGQMHNTSIISEIIATLQAYLKIEEKKMNGGG